MRRLQRFMHNLRAVPYLFNYAVNNSDYTAWNDSVIRDI